MAVHLQGCANLLDHALVHHHNAVCHGERLFLIMSHHDGGHAQALVQAADFEPQIGPHPGIKRAQRFIEQQQAGRQGQRPG